MKRELSVILRSLAAIFWLGFFMAISFMEAPLKFTAPGVSMAPGLEIGRIVFKWLNACESTFLAIILITCMIKKPAGRIGYIVSAITLIMLVESIYLLPVLDTHALLIINGKRPAEHTEHWLYVLLELLKVPLLAFVGLESSRPSYLPLSSVPAERVGMNELKKASDPAIGNCGYKQ